MHRQRYTVRLEAESALCGSPCCLSICVSFLGLAPRCVRYFFEFRRYLCDSLCVSCRSVMRLFWCSRHCCVESLLYCIVLFFYCIVLSCIVCLSSIVLSACRVYAYCLAADRSCRVYAYVNGFPKAIGAFTRIRELLGLYCIFCVLYWIVMRRGMDMFVLDCIVLLRLRVLTCR